MGMFSMECNFGKIHLFVSCAGIWNMLGGYEMGVKKKKKQTRPLNSSSISVKRLSSNSWCMWYVYYILSGVLIDKSECIWQKWNTFFSQKKFKKFREYTYGYSVGRATGLEEAKKKKKFREYTSLFSFLKVMYLVNWHRAGGSQSFSGFRPPPR